MSSNAGDAGLKALLRERHGAEQILAQALGHYPWYKDDPANFPGATEADGVCTGPFTLLDLAEEAAGRITACRCGIDRDGQAGYGVRPGDPSIPARETLDHGQEAREESAAEAYHPETQHDHRRGDQGYP